MRRDVSVETRDFLSSGVRCTADVYVPAAGAGPVPVVVMAHGFGSPRTLSLPRYAREFAAAGYAVVLFDYRYFGDSDGKPRQLLDIPSQLADWRAAIAFARSLPGVDPDRVIGWGTSFAGGHVLTLAAEGQPFAAAVAQVPHLSGPAAVRATGLRSALRLAPATVVDAVRALRGATPRYVHSIGAPGTTAVMTAPGAEEAFEEMARQSGFVRGTVPETVAARILLHIGRYSPIRTVSRITCPVLIQVADGDDIAPAASARAAAAKIPRSTVREYAGGHFDPYNDPLFPQVIGDVVDFLSTTVPPP
ncbi:MAG: alpha/beta fold hydrolase [Gordonia paraffinivorans]